MKTNDLKKGTRILLRNGWEAVLVDNLKGTIRYAEVFGDYTETGSIYAHDIIARKPLDAEPVSDLPKILYNGTVWIKDIEYTPAQIQCRESCLALGM
jgi:hypothetical protein